MKNAVANVVRGSSSAVVALVLPPFLTRLMSPERYGVWALILQLSAYVGYLDFGIQTAVGRFVAHSNERGDSASRDRIVSTSFAALTAAGILGIAGIAVVAGLIPRTFPQIPRAFIPDTRLALVALGTSLAVGLPASVFTGVMVGLQRYELPALVTAGSRALSAALIIIIVKNGGSLSHMAAMMALVNLVSYVLQYVIYRAVAPAVRISISLASREAGRKLLDYCLSLGVWSFAMLLVTGLDVLLVGYFQFEAVAYYAVAATLVSFLAGLQSAVFNAMIPSTAVQQARGDSEGLGRITITATRYGCFLLLLGGLPLIIFAKSILDVWVGTAYGAHGSKVLQILVIANIIRLTAVPYVMAILGTGQQRLVIVTPLLEGFSNLAVSLIAGYFFGAIGVAVGTLVGSIVGIAGNFLYNMRRASEIKLRVSDYVRDGLLRPLICALPLTVCAVLFWWNDRLTVSVKFSVLAGALVPTAILLWFVGLVSNERGKLRLQNLFESSPELRV